MKIAIIGAGPAGVNCAYWAAKEGHEVEVFERNKQLALKPCGEGIFKEAFDFTPVNPEGSKWALSFIHRAAVYHENKLISELDTKPFVGYIVNKRLFLEEIKDQAIAEGAKFYLEKEFKEKEDFDLIVDAGGYISNFSRKKGFPYEDYKLAPALRGYGRTNKIRDDTLYFEIYNFGYAWIFPYGKGKCNFGIGGHINDKSIMIEKLERFLKIFEVEKISSIEGAPFPSKGPIKKLRIGKYVVAGDSAGMLMPISGEGIRFALFAGKICFKEDYERIFEEKYGKKLKNGKKILEFWLSLSNDEINYIVQRLDPMTLARSFLEGEKPSFFEGIKLLSSVEIIKKALKLRY